ncbi:MAG TPA: enoyl-CoA hydratase-related protein [Propionibacteriaceae bacterium]|nr:enoyl-CoA hydratase-related protein [Propionibacteriaceae bacterium]
MTVRVEHPAAFVAELVMDRPEALNAISTQQAAALANACHRVAGDESVRVAVLASALPRAFCVGADLKERLHATNEELLAQRPAFRGAFAALLGLPMPVLAAVDGFALGGGCELALSCDLVVGSETATFGLPEVGLGLVPGCGGTQLLPRRVGAPRAAELIFTGRRVTGAEAARIGMVDRLVPPGQARAATLAWAVQIAAGSPVALRNAKQALRDGYRRPLAEALEIEDAAWHRAAVSADRVEGIAAFNEKRPARWPDPAPPSQSDR